MRATLMYEAGDLQTACVHGGFFDGYRAMADREALKLMVRP